MTIDYTNPLHVEAARGILFCACGRKLFCACGKVLDVRSSVEWTWDGREYVSCGECYDRVYDAGRDFSDVIDGRLLWPKAEPKTKRPPRRNVARKADLHVGDRVEIRVGARIVPVTIHYERVGYRRCAYFVGRNEVTGCDVKFTAAKVRRILEAAQSRAEEE